MCSGFYLKKGRINKEKIKRKSSYILKLLILGVAIYLIINIYFTGWSYVIGSISFLDIMKFMLFNAPQISSPHLWFLSALLYSYYIVYFIYHVGLEKYRLFIVLFLLGVHIVLSECILLIGIKIPHPIVRNAYLFGVPFLLIGDLLSDNINVLQQFSNRTLVCLTILGFLLSIIEKYAISPDDLLELYVGSIISSVCLFTLCIKIRTCKMGNLYYIGSVCSLGMYIWHPFVGEILMRSIFFECHFYDWVLPLMVIGISIVFGIGFHRVTTCISKK